MFAHLFQSGPDSATAVVCPLFHNTGYNDGLAHMLLANGRVDVPRRFDPAAVAAAPWPTAGTRSSSACRRSTAACCRCSRPRRRPPGSAPWFAYGGAPMPARSPRAFPGRPRRALRERLRHVRGDLDHALPALAPRRPRPHRDRHRGAGRPATGSRPAASSRSTAHRHGRILERRGGDARAKFDGPWLRTGDLARPGAPTASSGSWGGSTSSSTEAARRSRPSRSRARSPPTRTSWRRRWWACRTATWARSSGAAVVARPGSALDAAAARALPRRAHRRLQVAAHGAVPRRPAAQSRAARSSRTRSAGCLNEG